MRAPQRTLRAATAAVSGAALALTGLVGGAPTAAAAVLPASPGCTSGVCTFDLFAKASDPLALGGTATTAVFWSYTQGSGDAAAPIGPTLVVHEGDAVSVTLHNDLPATGVSEATSLAIPQLETFPNDPIGTAIGSSTTYSFTASRPGTFLYEAGPTEDGTRQVAMGMVGAFVVLPATGTSAYGTPETAYDDEAVVVMSEVDTRLHANPGTFDMRLFTPQFRLLNGQAHPDTDHIGATPGNTLLLRLVNGGVQQHALSVLGLRQHIVGISARELAHPYDAVSETVAAGDVMDTLIQIPTAQGALYPLYEPEGRLDNGGTRGAGGVVLTGGMATLIDTALGTGGANQAPSSTVTVTPPKRVTPGTAVSFDASFADDGSVTAAEYVVDDAAAPAGTGTPLPVVAGPSASVTGVSVDTTGLAFGTHAVLVRAQDDQGRWGPLAAGSFTVDDRGPAVSGVALNGLSSGGLEQFTTNGGQDVTLTATATEQGNGGGTVTAGTMTIDGTPTASPPTVSPSGGALTVGLAGTLTAAELAALAEGSHTVGVAATDDLGNTGTEAVQTFTVDTTAPSASGVVASPSPNNGQTGIPSNATAFEVTAAATDGLSGVYGGEAWLGSTDPGVGNGIALVPYGVGTIRGTIPLTALSAFADGPVTVNVRARDLAGNWSTPATGTLALDRQAPTVTLGAPSGTGSVTLTGTATDPGTAATGVVAAEYYVDNDPGLGAGTPITLTPGVSVALSLTLDTTSWVNGPHTVYVRARDAAGSWTTPSASATVTVVVTGPIFADGFEGSTLVPPWSSQVRQNGGTLTLSGAAPLVGSQSLVVGLARTARAYVTDGRPSAETGYTAGFRIRTEDLVTGSRIIDVFTARSGSGANTFRVQLRTSGGIQQLRIGVLRSGGTTFSSWVSLDALGFPNGHDVSVDWTAATSATVTLTVDGATRQVTGVSTAANRVDTAWLGASAGTGKGVSGSLKYDAFTSTR